MHIQTLRTVLGAVVTAAALFLMSCRESGPTEPGDPAIEAEEVSIFLTPGQSRTIAVNVAPANTAWAAESDDTNVAAVTRAATSVTITGVNVGFATVYLTMTQYPGISAQIAVEVTAQ